MNDQDSPYTVTQREADSRTGSRRDRQIYELRAENKSLRAEFEARLQELGDFVDTLARELSAFRRHVQFHSGLQPVSGCPACYPTAAEKEADQAFRSEAAETQRDVA